jgi:hypothetical protein
MNTSITASMTPLARESFKIGTLQYTTERPFCYLKIDDNNLQNLFNQFVELKQKNGAKQFNAQLPPFFRTQPNSHSNAVGAHMCVVSNQEINKNVQILDKLKEYNGNVYSIDCLLCKSVKPACWPAMEKIWTIIVEAPELTKLRTEKLGLAPLINGCPLSITLAVRPKKKSIPKSISLNENQVKPKAQELVGVKEPVKFPSPVKLCINEDTSPRVFDPISKRSYTIFEVLKFDFAKYFVSGTLKYNETPPHMVYLKLNDDLLRSIFTRFTSLHLPGICPGQLPPYYADAPNSFDNRIGAHISVISGHELGENPFLFEKVKNLQERKISIAFDKVIEVVPGNWKLMKKIWGITLKSKELEDFRADLNLPRLPNGHQFHTTFAVQPN